MTNQVKLAHHRTDFGLVSKILQIFPNQTVSGSDFFSYKILLLFSKPNWIRFGIFPWLKYSILFPNRIQFGSENFIDFLRFVFRTELESVRKRTLFKM